MVSFSCDNCQDVVTKPKVLHHFSSCRTRSVSCIDCGVVFSAQSVKAHTSCISEAQKHGPKGGGRQNTESYCVDCCLSLNGAVHSLQHYDSKKHKSTVRKKKAEAKIAAAAGAEPAVVDTTAVPPARVDVAVPVAPSRADADVLVEDVAASTSAPKGSKVLSLKKAMKQALKKAPGRKLASAALENAVREILGVTAGDDLGKRLQTRATHAPFRSSKRSVRLIADGT
jgi:uncharacterized membrane protein YkoI